MKLLNLPISEEDVETLIFCLSIYPLTGKHLCDSDIQHEINCSLCVSVAEKLGNSQRHFDSEEVRILAVSLQLVKFINSGAENFDQEVRAECSQYLFSVNKLCNIFDQFISDCK